jgi:hypothetical protein
MVTIWKTQFGFLFYSHETPVEYYHDASSSIPLGSEPQRASRDPQCGSLERGSLSQLRDGAAVEAVPWRGLERR